MTEDGSTLERELERLEEIVHQLEGDGLDLDQALELFEEGVRRLKQAKHRLGQAEGRVRRVLEDAAGDLSLADLDVP
jgi:exodeoxyribonuclease VII small subunit